MERGSRGRQSHHIVIPGLSCARVGGFVGDVVEGLDVSRDVVLALCAIEAVERIRAWNEVDAEKLSISISKSLLKMLQMSKHADTRAA